MKVKADKSMAAYIFMMGDMPLIPLDLPGTFGYDKDGEPTRYIEFNYNEFDHLWNPEISNTCFHTHVGFVSL